MSVSFARVAGTSTTYQATNAYTAVTGYAPTATPTGAFSGPDLSDEQMLRMFTKPYLDAHTLSFPSWRYSYYFWFILAGLFLIWVAFHQLHLRGGAVGAFLRKIGMRKVSLGKTAGPEGAAVKRRKWSSPTVGQMFGLAVMLVFTFCLCYIGPDFINPRECMFGGECQYHPVNGDNATNQWARRSLLAKRAAAAVVDGATSMHQLYKRRRARYGWSVLSDDLLSGPNFTIDKNFWASGNRVGLIAYAFLPLSVALALKQWPMNLLATPWLTNFHIDKTLFWHKWIGRLVWVLSTVHAGLWTKQLFIDLNPWNEPTWNTSWRWHRLLAGGIAYFALTAMVAFSFKPLRTRFYEIFYYSHVLLVLLFLVTIVIHYQALQGWGLLAACLWGLERLTRFCIFLYLNYGPGIPVFGEGRIGKAQFSTRAGDRESGFTVHNVEKRLSAENQRYMSKNVPYGAEEWSAASRSTQNLQDTLHPDRRQLQSAWNFGPGNDTPLNASQADLPSGAAQHQPMQAVHPASARTDVRTFMSKRGTDIPKGYALAQVLPGRVLKLVIHTPRHLSWAAGQHIQLTIPSVQWWESHPYTIASAQDFVEATDGQPQNGGSEITLLLSTRRGFTRRLYNSIVKKRKRLVSSPSFAQDKGSVQQESSQGVLIRAQTYLPAGSAGRVRWNDASTVIVVAAGTGITYALSVLQHLCYTMARKDASLRGEEASWSQNAGERSKKHSKPTRVERVRFVWILREYSHLAWIAPALRRCLDISDPARLRIDLFVTRELAQLHGVHPSQQGGQAFPSADASYTKDDGFFKPPRPHFSQHGRADSMDSSASDLSRTVVDLEEYHGLDTPMSAPPPSQQDATAEFSVTDMVLFDGEELEPPTAADEEISRSIRKEGKIRRAISRRKKKGLSSESAAPLTVSRKGSLAAPGQYGTDDLSGDESPYTPRSGQPLRSQATQVSPHMYPPPLGRFDAGSRRGSAYSAFTHLADGYGADSRKGNYSGASTPYGRKASTTVLPLLQDADLSFFDISPADRDDLNIIAELARGGRPDLDDIFDSEIEKSQGKVMVACCGPQTLNNHVREMVAQRISPGRIAKGDPRGYIELVSEDFSF